MNKFEETIKFLKEKDEFFAVKYDTVIEKIKKSRTPEGKDVEVTIEGVSPMLEDEEGYPLSFSILTKITIKEDKTTTVLTIANISGDIVFMPNYTMTKVAQVETTTKRLIGKKKNVYASRIAHIDDAFVYYGEEDGAIVSNRLKEVPVEFVELSRIAEIGRYHHV